MGFWTNKVDGNVLDDAEDLSYSPSGGPMKMWLLGVGLALIPVSYGVHCLRTGHATLFGQNSDLDVHGSGATALAIAYLSAGLFIHAHWFWGLLPRCEAVSYVLKILATLIFLGSLGFAIYRIVDT